MAVILSLTYSNLNAKNNYSSNALTGKWINEKEGIGMEIYRMHENFYGKIIWLQHPYYDHGNLKTDKKNPNQALRNRPLIEINIIKSLIYKGEKNGEMESFIQPAYGNMQNARLNKLVRIALY